MGRFVIRLDDLKFHARIGVMEQERLVGNEFTVSLSFTTDAAGFRMEELDTTVSYADVYEIVADAMRRDRLLLESVAREIADRIGERWPEVADLRVSITKCAPPINGFSGTATVEYRAE